MIFHQTSPPSPTARASGTYSRVPHTRRNRSVDVARLADRIYRCERHAENQFRHISDGRNHLNFIGVKNPPVEAGKGGRR
jgi:hypothetical protein